MEVVGSAVDLVAVSLMVVCLEAVGPVVISLEVVRLEIVGSEAPVDGSKWFGL